APVFAWSLSPDPSALLVLGHGVRLLHTAVATEADAPQFPTRASVGQQSACQEDLSFPRCEARPQPQLFASPGDPGTAFALTPLQDAVEVCELPLVSLSRPIVVNLIGKRERNQALS